MTLPSGQQYVEVFVRQNGIQNIATNIVSNATVHADGSTTYSLTRPGYSIGDSVEYRFYSYLPKSPGVFTPGPIEQRWQTYVYGRASSVNVPVLKDATLIRNSLCCGVVPDRNFGANATRAHLRRL